MTSLVDVIFLLLLFFMLTSTFSKFSEVELTSAQSGAVASTSDNPPLFLRLGPEDINLNGTDHTLETVAEALQTRAQPDEDSVVLISLRQQVSAQRLTDLLVALRDVTGIRVTVLGS